MPMHREGFSQFLHQRRVALGRRWSRILSDAYLSRATLHRIRHGDPHHPIAEINSLRSLANALCFPSWSALVVAYEANDPRAGIDSIKTDEPKNGQKQPNGDAVIELSNALNLTPT